MYSGIMNAEEYKAYCDVPTPEDDLQQLNIHKGYKYISLRGIKNMKRYERITGRMTLEALKYEVQRKTSQIAFCKKRHNKKIELLEYNIIRILNGEKRRRIYLTYGKQWIDMPINYSVNFN